MTGYEIVILLIGLAFLIFSFLVGKNEESGEAVDTNKEILKIKEAAVFQEQELRAKVSDILERETEEAVSDVEDKLNHISNEKIMAVDDYSRQILDKIENNHQEVVFLYDMLQKKEDEMKSTMNKMEQTRRENKELFERLEELKAAKARVNSRNAGKKADVAQEVRKRTDFPEKDMKAVKEKSSEMMKDNNVSLSAGASGESEMGAWDAEAFIKRNSSYFEAEEKKQTDVKALENVSEADKESEESGMTEEEKKETVLALFKNHKSIREISKQLSMGQGEVKLIIDLYGK